MLNLFTHQIEPLFKLASAVFRAVALRASAFGLLRHEQMGNARLSLAGLRSEGAFIQWHRAPPDKIKAATAPSHSVLGNLHGASTLSGITRQKEHANRQPPLRVEAGIQVAGFASKKGGRELDHDAGAVTAGTVGVHTTAVRKMLQAHERLLQHAIRRRLAQLRDETHTTGIVLLRPVETVTAIGLGRLWHFF